MSLQDILINLKNSLNNLCYFNIFGYNLSNEYNKRILKLNKNLHLLPKNKLILCFGNTKDLWYHAKELLQNNIQDPFDKILVPNAIKLSLEICQKYNLSCNIFMSHSFEPYLLSFQDLAVITDIGVYSNDLKLVIHPIYGPWFALRFALLIDCDNIDPNELNLALENRPICNLELNEEEFKEAAKYLSEEYDPLSHILARKSISLGSNEMYDDDQIAYHYGLNR